MVTWDFYFSWAVFYNSSLEFISDHLWSAGLWIYSSTNATIHNSMMGWALILWMFYSAFRTFPRPFQYPAWRASVDKTGLRKFWTTHCYRHVFKMLIIQYSPLKPLLPFFLLKSTSWNRVVWAGMCVDTCILGVNRFVHSNIPRKTCKYCRSTQFHVIFV